MSLNTNAIITVQQALDHMGLPYVQSPAFDIYNTSGSNTTATVAVSDTTLTLVGSGTGTDSFTLGNASYDTMGELTAAIDALGEGWQVVLLSGSTVTSTYLVPRAAVNVYGQANTQRFYYANTEIVGGFINAASQAIEKYLDSAVKSATFREWADGRGDSVILLRNAPVTAVKRVAYGSSEAFYVQNTTSTDLRATVEVQDSQIVLSRVASNGTETATSLTFATYPTASDLVTQINLTSGWSATLTENCMSLDLHRRAGADARGVNVSATFPDTSASVRHVDESVGSIVLGTELDVFDDGIDSGRHLRGRHNYLVEYTAGYSTVPSDIEDACKELVQALYFARGKDESLQSEALGDYQYTRAAPTVGDASSLITGRIAGLLSPYRRRGF